MTYTCKNDPSHIKTEPISANTPPDGPTDAVLTLYAYPIELPDSMTAGNTIRFEAYMLNRSELEMVDGFIAISTPDGFYSENYVTADRDDPETVYVTFEREITAEEEKAGLLTVTFVGRGMPNGEEYSEIDAAPVVLTFATGKNAAPVISVTAESWPAGSYPVGALIRIPAVLKVLSDKPVTLERFVYQRGDGVQCDDEMEAPLGLQPGQEYGFTYVAKVRRSDLLNRTGYRTLSVCVSDADGILYNASCVLGFSVTPQVTRPHTHEFGNWRTVVPLTRRDDGLRERRCLICGFPETQILEAAPRIVDGQKGPKVELIEHILDDLGYKPIRVTGHADRDFWTIVEDWSRDHDWYYEPGLLRPVVIDDMVHQWVDQDQLVSVSGEGTAVNIVLTVTPDRNFSGVQDGELLNFSWEAVNLGMEDCRLGPILVSYGKNNTTKDVDRLYRFVADLNGNTLKAGGANTLTGTFSLVADFGKTQERSGYDADSYTQTKYGKLYVNVRLLGTSLETNRKWYSNTFSKRYLVSDDTVTTSPDLKVYGGAVNEKEFYCANDSLEYLAGLTYTGDAELHDAVLKAVMVGYAGRETMYSRHFDTLAPGTDFSKLKEYLLGNYDTATSKLEFWIEAYGYTPEGDLICAEKLFFTVDTHSEYDTLVLSVSGGPREPSKIYKPEDTVYYSVALDNLSDEPLTDYTIRVSLTDSVDYLMSCEFNGASVGAHESTHMYPGGIPLQGSSYSGFGTALLATATAYTKDGRRVEARPVVWNLYVDKPDAYPPASRLLLKIEQTSPAKEKYEIGDEVTFWCELTMDGEEMPGYMVVDVSKYGDTLDFVCETGDGGASSPSGAHFGNQAYDETIGGSYTLRLEEENIVDGCVSVRFEGACAKEPGEGFSHNSNRIAFTFPIS